MSLAHARWSTKDVIHPGVTGVLVAPPADAAGDVYFSVDESYAARYVAALVDLVTSPASVVEEMGRAAMSVVTKRYSVETYAARHADLLEHVVAAATRGSGGGGGGDGSGGAGGGARNLTVWLQLGVSSSGSGARPQELVRFRLPRGA